ncbi:hypothetical protein scyTo_0024031, partial [Scyliorhinus torazame]|nr:hypothetical protein [Scyliorhinus torazame]
SWTTERADTVYIEEQKVLSRKVGKEEISLELTVAASCV